MEMQPHMNIVSLGIFLVSPDIIWRDVWRLQPSISPLSSSAAAMSIGDDSSLMIEDLSQRKRPHETDTLKSGPRKRP
jgi:hypothetical protein